MLYNIKNKELLYFINIASFLCENSADPDQTKQNVASDQGLTLCSQNVPLKV